MSLVKEVASDKPYNEIISKYLARLIMIGILRLANISEAKFVTNGIFTRIHNYLNKHYTEIESMDQICEELKISKYYLSHVFKKYMGKPPMQYVATKRIVGKKISQGSQTAMQKTKDMVEIAEFIKLAATDFENSADYIREKVTAICDKYPLYK